MIHARSRLVRPLLLIVMVAAGACSRTPEERPPAAVAPPAPARFVGAEACASCHAQEVALWRGSHHQRAMMPANDQSVAAPFTDTTFTYSGVTSRFSKREGQFIVKTDGPDGKLSDYPVAYTFGVDPLQQVPCFPFPAVGFKH